MKFYLSDSRIGLKQADVVEYEWLKSVKNEVELASKGLKVARHKEHQETKAQDPLPPNLFQLQEVLRRVKLVLMEKAKTEALGKVAVSRIHRDICCPICLTQSHRRSLVKNPMLREYQQSLSRPSVQKYDAFHCREQDDQLLRCADDQQRVETNPGGVREECLTAHCRHIHADSSKLLPSGRWKGFRQGFLRLEGIIRNPTASQPSSRAQMLERALKHTLGCWVLLSRLTSATFWPILRRWLTPSTSLPTPNWPWTLLLLCPD